MKTGFKVFSIIVILAFLAVALPIRLVRADTNNIVTPASPDWGFISDNGTTGDWVAGFETGPGTPPMGIGSATIELNSAAAGIVLATQKYQGVLLSAITTLSYSTYTNLSPASMSFQINYDPDLLTGAPDPWYGRLTYEPYMNGTVTNGTWQTWDMINSGNALWWASPNAGSTVDEACPQGDPCTLTELLTAFPNIGIRNDANSAILFKAGSSWNGFVGNIDNLTFSTAGNTDTYDFEPLTAVFVDDSWSAVTPGTDPDGAGPAQKFGVDSFITLQEGITAVTTGGTVYVAPGTYTEIDQIVINKNLSIIGENKETTIIKPSGPTGAVDDTRGWFLVNAGYQFNLSNVTLDGTGQNIHTAIRTHGTGLINNINITNIKYSKYVGVGIYAYGGTTVNNTTLTNIERIGLYANTEAGASGHPVFTGNTYIGKGVGDWLDYGIEVENGATATISNNNISNCVGVASSDGSTSAGIYATTYFAPGTTATITGNILTDNYVGIAVGYLPDDSTTVVATDNQFSGNTYAISTTSTTTSVSATANWYGSISGPAAGQIDGLVTYSPWCGDSECSFLVYGVLPGYTIQSAIDAAPSGGTVYVPAGIYPEQILINKPLTLTGEDGAVLDGTGLLPEWTTGVKIRSGNVTFNNIDVTNYTQDGITAYDNIDMPNIHITNSKISNIQPGYWGFGIYVGYESEGFGYTPPDLTTHLNFSGLLIEGNEITNVHSSALVIQSLTGTAGSLIVRNNNIHDNTTNSGIWVDCARNLLIENNTVDGNKWGVEFSCYAESSNTLNGLYSPKDIILRNNQITDSTQDGIAIYEAWPGTLDINGNTLTGNTPAIHNYLAASTDASPNWFGSDSGPAEGQIVGLVSYVPYCLTSACEAPFGSPPVHNTTQDTYFTTIQAAIDAAATGNTIEVAPGTYVESLDIIGKNISLLAPSGATIESPVDITTDFTTSDVNSAVVYLNNTTSTIDGFTIDGASHGNANYRFYGVAFYNAGGAIQNTTVKNIQDSPFSGAQHGNAIYAYNSDGTARTINVTGNTVYDFQKNGITMNGVLLTANVDDNDVTCKGTIDITAQNGIQFGWGSTGSITNNTVTGCSYHKDSDLDYNWSATGILLYGTGAVTVTGNDLSGNSQNLYISDPTAAITVGANTFGAVTGPVGSSYQVINFSDFDVDLSPSTFEGLLLSSATPAQLLSFAARVFDGIDYPDVSGVAMLKAGYQFVDAEGSIQAAIAAANPGDTILVAAGTYTEIGQIVIDKNLTIIGEDQATTIIQPAQDTGNSGDTRGWFLVRAGVTFNMSNVTLDGNGFKVWQGIRHFGSGTINNVAFTDLQYEASGASYAGTAVAAAGGVGANVNITYSSFNNIGRIGAMFFGVGTTGTFDHNTYTGKGDGDWLDYGVEVGGGGVATITNNTFTDCTGVALSDDSTSAGVMVTTYYGAGSSATFTGNTFSNNATGIAVGFDESDTSVVTAENNRFIGNDFGITSTAPLVDADRNYWGTAQFGLIDAQNDTPVSFNPYWVDYAMTILSSDPVTPVFVDDDYSATVCGGHICGYDAFAMIEQGVAAVSAGGVVNVAAGTYYPVGTIYLNKALSILGPTTGEAIVSGVGGATVKVFEISESNVTVQNLTITLATAPTNYDGLINIPDKSISNINILDNEIYVASQSGAMSTWWARAVQIGRYVTDSTVSRNTMYNTRSGLVVGYNSALTIADNVIYNTKGGIMNYTGSAADAANRIMTNNSWNGIHSEWDIVWNSGGGPYDLDEHTLVLLMSQANNDAYVVSQMPTVYTTPAQLIYGNRSHVFVNAATGTTTIKNDNGNINVPYAKIQDGIDAVVPGGKVIVAGGTYPEQVSIAKAVDLRGPNYGISAGVTPGTRVAEAVITFPAIPIATDPSEEFAVIYANADDVSINGFTLDGLGVADGVGVNAAEDNLIVVNNIVKNFRRIGIWDSSYKNVGGTWNYSFYTSGALVEDNMITYDLSGGYIDYMGIYLQGAMGTVRGNVVDNARSGIQIQPYNNPSTTQGLVENNLFKGFKTPMYFNYSENVNVNWLFRNNIAEGIAYPSGFTKDIWDGIRVETFYAGNVTFTDNTIIIGTSDGTTTNLARKVNVTGGLINGLSPLINVRDANTWKLTSGGLSDLAYCADGDTTCTRLLFGAPVKNVTRNTGHGTIQSAIDAASPNDVIEISAGTYIENVIVDVPVEIYGVSRINTIIMPAISSPNCGGASGASLCAGSSNVFLVQADDVTIHDLTIEGDNPALTGGFDVGGANVDARNGIITNHAVGAFDNMEIYNVTMNNIYLRGIYASSGGTFNIHNNTITNVQGEGASIAIMNWVGAGTIANNIVSYANDAIAANHSSGTQFLNNVVAFSGSGVHSDNAGDGGGVSDALSGNTVTDCAAGGYGVWTFNNYYDITVEDNVVTGCYIGYAAFGSRYATSDVQFNNNTATGPGLVGIYVSTSLLGYGDADVYADFTGNSVSGYDYGIYTEGTADKSVNSTFFHNQITGSSAMLAEIGTDGTYNINMEENWWGARLVPDATKINAAIDYTRWCGDAACSFLYPAALGEPVSGPKTSWDNTFHWSVVPGSTLYRLSVANIDTGVTIINQFFQVGADVTCSLTECTLSPSALANLPNGNYRWKIQDYQGGIYGLWTDPSSFTLAVPATNTPITPTGTLTSWDNTFHWTGVPGSTLYRLFVANVDTGVTIINQYYTVGSGITCVGTDCTLSPAALANLPNGNYRWMIQDYRPGVYGTWSSFMNFTLAVPVTKILHSPANTLTTWNNSFHWTGVPGSTHYRLYLSVNGLTLVNQFYRVGTDITCDGLDCTLSPAVAASLPNGNHKWKIQEYSALAGYGTWSEYKDFALAVPVAKTLISPAGPVTSWDNTFRWSVVPGATHYRLFVANGAGITLVNQFYVVGSGVTCNATECTLSPALTASLPNGNYTWRIQEYSASLGYGIWSSVTDFTLAIP